jgi:PmbA protein
LVLNVLGVHTLDASSGDFSLAAPQTLRVTSEGLGGRLRVTLSGNVFALLRSATLRPVRFEGEHVPGLLLRCRIDPR